MTEFDPNALATNGGFAAGLLWVLYRIGLRMITVMDKHADHTVRIATEVTVLRAEVKLATDVRGEVRGAIGAVTRGRARTSPGTSPSGVPIVVDE